MGCKHVIVISSMHLEEYDNCPSDDHERVISRDDNIKCICEIGALSQITCKLRALSVLHVVMLYFSLCISLNPGQKRNRAECEACGLQRVSFAFVIRSVIPWGGSQMHSLFHTAAGLRMQTSQK